MNHNKHLFWIIATGGMWLPAYLFLIALELLKKTSAKVIVAVDGEVKKQKASKN